MTYKKAAPSATSPANTATIKPLMSYGPATRQPVHLKKSAQTQVQQHQQHATPSPDLQVCLIAIA